MSVTMCDKVLNFSIFKMTVFSPRGFRVTFGSLKNLKKQKKKKKKRRKEKKRVTFGLDCLSYNKLLMC